MKTMIALAMIATAAVPALADAPKTGSWKVGNDSYHIYYADLDMNSSEGRAQLLVRVNKAAAGLCHEPIKIDQKACVADTVAMLANHDIQRALADRAAVQLAAR
jgi:UrcA family protein